MVFCVHNKERKSEMIIFLSQWNCINNNKTIPSEKKKVKIFSTLKKVLSSWPLLRSVSSDARTFLFVAICSINCVCADFITFQCMRVFHVPHWTDSRSHEFSTGDCLANAAIHSKIIVKCYGCSCVDTSIRILFWDDCVCIRWQTKMQEKNIKVTWL